MFALLLACDAGPLPGPVDAPPQAVEWQSPSFPVTRPLAVFVDAPGGAMDLLARDPHVTTFLNDRFHPLLVPSFGTQPPGSAAIYTPDGCLLAGPFQPTPEVWIAAANAVMALRPSGSAARAEVRDCGG